MPFRVSPYLGLTYDLTPQVSLYASYTDIFNPQSETFADHDRLPAAHGKSYEAGIKSEVFDKRLYLAGAVYKAEQSDLADYAGTDDNGQAYYVGLDTRAVLVFGGTQPGRSPPSWRRRLRAGNLLPPARKSPHGISRGVAPPTPWRARRADPRGQTAAIA